MYFAANGQQLGTRPPQAATNGFGAMPPQASTNGLGRYGMIGMLPPQAAAGLGADMTPSGVPEGPMTSWRDGIFGARRQPEPFGDQLYPPWRDGIFGPSLGQTNGGPALTLTGDAVTEVKTSLNLLVASYTPTPGQAYDAATEAAYVTWAEEQTPGYPDKAVLYKLVGERRFPSARGIYVLMQSARVKWAEDVGQQDSYTRVAQWYPTLWAFAEAFEGADYSGSVIVPETATVNGAFKASTVALIGVSAVGIGLLAVMLKPKKYRANPKRKKGGRRKKTTRRRKSVRGLDAILADLEKDREPTKREIESANRALRKIGLRIREIEAAEARRKR